MRKSLKEIGSKIEDIMSHKNEKDRLRRLRNFFEMNPNNKDIDAEMKNLAPNVV